MDQPSVDEEMIKTSTTKKNMKFTLSNFTNTSIPQNLSSLPKYSKIYCPRKRTVTSNCRMRPYYIPEKRIRTKSENNIEPNNSIYLDIINSIVNNPPVPTTTGAMLIDNHDAMDTQFVTPAKPLKKARSLESINKSKSECLLNIEGIAEKSFHEMEFVLTSRIQNMKVQE